MALYSRQYCHLCHDMLSAVEAMRDEFSFELDVVDVDADPELGRCYNELVPLLMHGDRELARWRLNAAGLRAYLSDIV